MCIRDRYYTIAQKNVFVFGGGQSEENNSYLEPDDEKSWIKDGLGFKKLPTIKALNTEYAELLAEKKAAYADYRKAREEMKELLTAKANIDRILELDKELEEANERREKEAEQR